MLLRSCHIRCGGWGGVITTNLVSFVNWNNGVQLEGWLKGELLYFLDALKTANLLLIPSVTSDNMMLACLHRCISSLLILLHKNAYTASFPYSRNLLWWCVQVLTVIITGLKLTRAVEEKMAGLVLFCNRDYIQTFYCCVTLEYIDKGGILEWAEAR